MIHVAGEPHVCERRIRQLCSRCGLELTGYELDLPPFAEDEELQQLGMYLPVWWTVGISVGHDGMRSWWITREPPTCAELQSQVAL